MGIFSRLFIILAAALALFTLASPADAQATRTWVSGVGDDVNPCSRTAPCKTFAGAISKTAANGEINCLDPGGFGAITITKSITIDCTGTMGSILNSGTNGIIVNDSLSASPNTADVMIRGLSIDGGGSTAGINGVRMVSGRSLVLQDVFIQNQNGTTGISLQPGGATEVYMEDVTVTDAATGVFIQPTGAAGSVRAVMRNVRVQNNAGIGLNINTSGNSSAQGVVVAIDKSSFSGNATGLAVVTVAGSSAANVMMTDSVLAFNNTAGMIINGSLARVRVANSSITGNGTGLTLVNGAIANSYGTNRLDGNNTNGAFTTPVLPQQ